MARTEKKLSAGIKESDYQGLGLLFDAVPFPAVKDALKANGLQTQRVRKLPLELMVYYVICLSLFARVSMRNVLSCMLEGCTRLHLDASGEFIQSSGAISSARNRLGWKVMRYLFNQTCVPLSDDDDLFSRYHGLLMLAIDGTCVNMPDEKANSDYFGRQAVAEGRTGFPQARITAVCETGTHAIVDAEIDPYHVSENAQVARMLGRARNDAIYLMDRNFSTYSILSSMLSSGVHFLARMRTGIGLAKVCSLRDGSYIATMCPKGHGRKGVTLRVVEYRLVGSPETYRVVTDLLDEDTYPARELAALYHERWEVESVFDEMKNHMKLPAVPVRSKTPDLVLQELYGYFITHYIIRRTMYRAARRCGTDADTISFTGTVEILKRKVVSTVFPLTTSRAKRIFRELEREVAATLVTSSRGMYHPRRLKRKTEKKWERDPVAAHVAMPVRIRIQRSAGKVLF